MRAAHISKYQDARATKWAQQLKWHTAEVAARYDKYKLMTFGFKYHNSRIVNKVDPGELLTNRMETHYPTQWNHQEAYNLPLFHHRNYVIQWFTEHTNSTDFQYSVTWWIGMISTDIKTTVK